MSCRVLRNGQRDFWFTLHSWAQMIEAAHAVGAWYPGDTEPPILGETITGGYVYAPGEWHGGWLTAEGQTVPAEEAESLAGALAKVLEELSDEDEHEPWVPTTEEERMYQVSEENVFWQEWFSGPAKQHLREFAEFCLEGSFVILDEYEVEDLDENGVD